MTLPRKKIISANWKMNITASEVAPYLTTFLEEMKQIDGVDVILIPSFTSLPKTSELLTTTQGIRLGAQNISSYDKGAFTGEISASMLRDLFVHHVLIGHSERRHLFGETNAVIHEKMKMTLRNEMKPILCVGETLEERRTGKEKQVIEQQLREGLQDLSLDQIDNTMIAYEPVWAIGTGQTATVEQAQEAHFFIRSIITELSNISTSQKMRLHYGGSVTPHNAEELLSAPDIDGALVGSASLDPHSFAKIVLKAQST
ncbi:MAG: triose-phosphate isomerase [Chthoniobacterales bacterium]|nr:triose-phosphate isomerase [Chthoniobacterales bacterium]